MKKPSNKWVNVKYQDAKRQKDFETNMLYIYNDLLSRRNIMDENDFIEYISAQFADMQVLLKVAKGKI